MAKAFAATANGVKPRASRVSSKATNLGSLHAQRAKVLDPCKAIACITVPPSREFLDITKAPRAGNGCGWPLMTWLLLRLLLLEGPLRVVALACAVDLLLGGAAALPFLLLPLLLPLPSSLFWGPGRVYIGSGTQKLLPPRRPVDFRALLLLFEAPLLPALGC